MLTFTLILFFHVGAMGDGNSNAVTNIQGFVSEQECLSAGAQTKQLVLGTVKKVEYICVKQTVPQVLK